MDKVKRVLAMIGVILLLALYVIAILLAFFGNNFRFFIVAIIATVIVPVLIWAYSFIYRLLKNHYRQEDED